MDMVENAAGTNSIPTGDSRFEGFGQLADALRNAVSRFEAEQTPENFAGIISALSGFGLSGVELWKQAAEFTKKHPMQVAVMAGLLFFAVKGLGSMRSQRQLASSEVH